MAYKHGTYQYEVATSLVPAAQVNTPLVVFGVAPMYNATSPAEVNVPKLCYTLTEAKAAFGWSDDYANFDICETMDAAFGLYNIAPIVCVNVLDVTKHRSDEKSVELTFTDGEALIDGMVIADSVALADYTADIDYSVSVAEGGALVTMLKSGVVTASATYREVDPSKVTANDVKDVIAQTKYIHPRFGMIPAILIAPRFNNDGGVLAALKSNAASISEGRFSCVALADIDDTVATTYDKVKLYKDSKNVVQDNGYLFACWPKVTNGDYVYRYSTHLACLMLQIDATDSDGAPYQSPSNHGLQIDGTQANGKSMFLEHSEATYLNSIGIVTAYNSDGWKCWGNRTTCYPANTDVKDAFIPVRRMFSWILNNLTVTYFSKIDKPANKRLIGTVVDSANDWLNGHTASGHILGGRVVFREEDNTTTGLMDGILKFHVFITPPSPAREIDFIAEYDTGYVSTLFD